MFADDGKDWWHHHFFQGMALMMLALAAGWVLGYWRRHRELRRAAKGDAREMLTVEQVLVRDLPDGHTTLRIRSVGAAALDHVLTRPVIHDEFLRRTRKTKQTDPLLALHDQMGSYLLHLLQPWVCGLCRGGSFAHDVWIMVPVCEPGLLSEHQATTIVLVREADLKRFRDWEACKRMRVEHGSDGARILTLWHIAREYDKQHAEVKRRREKGERTIYVETMYVLDLGLDTQEVALPTKPVPWGRFDAVLKELGLAA